MSPAATLSDVDDEARDERKADPCPPKAETDVAETAAKNAAIFMVIASVLKIAIDFFCGLVMVPVRAHQSDDWFGRSAFRFFVLRVPGNSIPRYYLFAL